MKDGWTSRVLVDILISSNLSHLDCAIISTAVTGGICTCWIRLHFLYTSISLRKSASNTVSDNVLILQNPAQWYLPFESRVSFAEVVQWL
jgi:hypothetical protein